ncbi:MAG: hypothetical protein WCK98_07255 [bacterium]
MTEFFKNKNLLLAYQENGNGVGHSNHQEVVTSLEQLKTSIQKPEATESLFDIASFDMLSARIANLDVNDPSWQDVSRRVLNLIALHDGDSKTDSWDDFGLYKKEDIANLLHLLRQQIYGPNALVSKQKSEAKSDFNETQTGPSQWVKEIFFRLNEFRPEARKTILKLLVNLGYVTTQKPVNPLSQDQILTQSAKYVDPGNVNKITLEDGTICYLTNNHVKFPQNGSLVESGPSLERYDLKLLRLVDGSKKVGCRAEMLKLVKFETIKDSQNYLQRKPQLTLKTNQSLFNPADPDQVFNDKTSIEPGVNTSTIAAKYLFGTPNNFFYTIENGDQTVPGTSGGGIYDSDGQLIALHNAANYYYGNLSLYKDILNSELIDLNEIFKVASLPDFTTGDSSKKDSTLALKENFKRNLIASGQYTSQQAGVYNTRLLGSLIDVISKELKQTGGSQTFNLLQEKDLGKIINHGIDLSFESDMDKVGADRVNSEAKKAYYRELHGIVKQNRLKILDVVLQGKQIATAVPITRESIRVLEAN